MFLLKVGPVGLVPNTVILSGDVRGILDHQAIIRPKTTVLDILKEPPEGGGLLRRRHGSLWSCKEDQIGQAQSEGTTCVASVRKSAWFHITSLCVAAQAS